MQTVEIVAPLRDLDGSIFTSGPVSKTFFLAVSLAALSCNVPVFADSLPVDVLAEKVEPPNVLGEKLSEDGVWSIVDPAGIEAGYVFQTGPLAPLPGFSGEPLSLIHI